MIFISFLTDLYHFSPLPSTLLLIQNQISMSAIYILIAVSFIVAIGFLLAFLWSVKTDQYEDDYSPSVRMLMDDSKKRSKNS